MADGDAVNFLLAIPLAVRVAGLFVLGACVGSFANLAIYQLGLTRRTISPWTPGLGDEVRWTDRLPLAGWFFLQRNERELGRGFWLRPLVVELLMASLFAILYVWEVEEAGLLPVRRGVRLPPDVLAALHLNYLSHVVLASLMVVASFIDIDDRVIPDPVTVPGTLLGLLLAAAVPFSLLPVLVLQEGSLTVDFLKLTSPNDWPAWLGGRPHAGSLAIGLACYWGWCFALLQRPWRGRRGYWVALRLLTARVARGAAAWPVLVRALLGGGAIAAVWWTGGARWMGLLTALVGLAVGGGLVWIVRIIGTGALRREAMGFGDVTLMAMIGAFLGWQPAVMVFFIAPFFALVVGVGSWVLHRQPEIPYGPFLCLAALVVVVRWAAVWEWAEPIFMLGWLVPAVLAVAMVLLGGMLGALQLLRPLLGLRDEQT